MILSPIADEGFIVIDDDRYELAEIQGRRQWDVTMTPESEEVRVPLRLYGGFGATHRFTDGRDQTDPTHHDYAENMLAGHKGEIIPSSVITYLDLSTLHASSQGFQFGGTTLGQFGGGLGSFGGGSGALVSQAIREFGEHLYITDGIHTHVVDPAASTPDLKETRVHGNQAQGRSSDVYDGELVVALGQGTAAEGVDRPFSGDQFSHWRTFDAGVSMNVYRRGKAGRLYAAGGSKGNLVFQVLPGSDPATLASYVPSSGEEMGDETHPITAIEEFSDIVIAAKEDNVLFFDPDAGFYSRSILPEIGDQPADFVGRGMFSSGSTVFVPTRFGFWMLEEGRVPRQVGPELLDHNQSPYVGLEFGKGAAIGRYALVPAFIPSTGHSVIFSIRRREPGEPGTGILVWDDFLYLANRESRVVFFWKGTSTVKPRAFFGAATTANKEQVGWIDLPIDGNLNHPDDSDGKPARTSVIFAPADDLGAPGVTDEVKRIELPRVVNTDESNYFVVSVSADYGSNYTDLVQENDGSSFDERITSTGFQQVFAPIDTPIAAESLKVQIASTQAAAATTYVAIQGIPILVVRRLHQATQAITTLLKSVADSGQTIEDIRQTLQAMVGGQKVLIRDAPGATTFWAEIRSVDIIPFEDADAGTLNDTRVVRVRMQEVNVDAA